MVRSYRTREADSVGRDDEVCIAFGWRKKKLRGVFLQGFSQVFFFNVSFVLFFFLTASIFFFSVDLSSLDGFYGIENRLSTTCKL